MAATDDGDDGRLPGLDDLLQRNLAGELHEPVPEPGLVVADKWTLTQRLGSGGFGTVFEAWHVELDQAFAIKFLAGRHGQVEARQAFLEEARLMAQLRGRHLVRVLHCADLPDGTPYYVMDLVQGRSLRQHMRVPLSLAESGEIVEGVLEGLCEVHAHGYAHGDLKPENIALSDTGARVRLLDFGLARTSALVGGGIGGTPPYMAPEAVLDGVMPNARADLYAVGVIFYEMVAGRLPRGHRGMGVDEVRQSWSRRPNAVPVRVHRPEVPEEVDRLIMDALSREPRDRPPTAMVMLQRLRASWARRAPVVKEGTRPKNRGMIIGVLLPTVAVATVWVTKGEGSSSTFDDQGSRLVGRVGDMMIVEANARVTVNSALTAMPATAVDDPVISSQEPKVPRRAIRPYKRRKRVLSPDELVLKVKKREIKAKCAMYLGNRERLKMFFFVEAGGEVELITARPKGQAEECATRQAQGIRFQPRTGAAEVLTATLE